jgi:hypothetical protein
MTNHPSRKRSPGHIVTLIRGRSGFANVADKFLVMQPGYIIDETYEDVQRYYLPAGYKVALSNGEQLCIYDTGGQRCEIVQHNSGRPQLVTGGRDMPVLKRKVAA